MWPLTYAYTCLHLHVHIIQTFSVLFWLNWKHLKTRCNFWFQIEREDNATDDDEDDADKHDGGDGNFISHSIASALDDTLKWSDYTFCLILWLIVDT